MQKITLLMLKCLIFMSFLSHPMLEERQDVASRRAECQRTALSVLSNDAYLHRLRSNGENPLESVPKPLTLSRGGRLGLTLLSPGTDRPVSRARLDGRKVVRGRCAVMVLGFVTSNRTRALRTSINVCVEAPLRVCLGGETVISRPKARNMLLDRRRVVEVRLVRSGTRRAGINISVEAPPRG
jgi:hypothetical protein